MLQQDIEYLEYVVPGTEMRFEVPYEWWKCAGMIGLNVGAEHYHTDLSVCSEIVFIEDVEPPKRYNGFWFRNRDSVIEVLCKMRSGEILEPIEVYSKSKTNTNKFTVKDGFHRFYLSVAVGYKKIPVKVNDFEMKEFLGGNL
jgi:hypothetical protein